MNVEKEVDYVDLSTDKTPHYMVMCMERNIGENHQCCCGQVYSNKNNKCPLCGKERRGK